MSQDIPISTYQDAKEIEFLERTKRIFRMGKEAYERYKTLVDEMRQELKDYDHDCKIMSDGFCRLCAVAYYGTDQEVEKEYGKMAMWELEHIS